ncbi:MAG: ABC transporter ATP-binding protein [Spirochaetes bacterium]|nr:ABC transporter ATP-binding protein [Spirochaetota bacterium]MBU1081245.1 ABC transporter ATP-binding protein [Spirochaetota bacterium]
MTAIRTAGLGKVYEGGTLALAGLGLEVPAGTVYGLLGPNGAGKSTVTRILNGTLSPSSGRAEVLGSRPESEETRRRTSTVTETARMYEALTLLENLRFYARMHDVPEAGLGERIDALLRRLELEPKRDEPLGNLSTGMKKRAQLARALLHDPELLFLDEPTSGLDPASAREVVALIRELVRERGVTVLLCTHDLALADTVCDAYGFIDRGALRASGTRAELQEASGIPDRLRVATTSGELSLPVPPEGDCNALLGELMASGRRVVELRVERPSLERLYFHFIRKDD